MIQMYRGFLLLFQFLIFGELGALAGASVFKRMDSKSARNKKARITPMTPTQPNADHKVPPAVFPMLEPA